MAEYYVVQDNNEDAFQCCVHRAEADEDRYISCKGRSSRKIHECGVKPCWCGKSRSTYCIPYAENDVSISLSGNTRMYISEVIQKRYVVCCPEFDVENEEMLWSSERLKEVVLQAEIMEYTNVSICLTFALKCCTKIQCLLSSLLVMEKYMEYFFGVRRGSACDLMIAEAVLRNEIGWHWEAEEAAFTWVHQGILAIDLVEWS